MDHSVRRTELASGTRVVTEHVPGSRSASVGVWVGVGGRDEPAEHAGVSHFLEHLLFRGTHNRDARSMATSLDALGGELNAYTAKEYTVFYLRVPARATGPGLELLVDLIAAPVLDAADVAREREVILEELAAAADSPEDTAEELLWQSLFPDHPLGWDVLGTAETVASMSRDAVEAFFRRWYRPGNLVVAASGSVAHEDVVQAAQLLDPLGSVESCPPRLPPHRQPQAVSLRRRSTEQVQLALGWRSPGYRHADRVALDVIEQVLGGGPSSRLFQEIREERSLAYSVYSSVAEYTDVGAVGVHAGVRPERTSEALAVIRGVIDDLAGGGLSQAELDVAKGYLEGSMWLGLEDNPSRMGRIAWWELAERRVPPPEAYLAELERLTLDDVNRLAASVFAAPGSVAAVGPLRRRDLGG